MFLYKSATNKEKTTNPILVAKHGSHNQASHGRKGGRGGGGGATTSTNEQSKKLTPRQEAELNMLGTDTTYASDLATNLEREFPKNSAERKSVEAAQMRLVSATNSLEDAVSASGAEHEKTIVSAVNDLEDAFDELNTLGDAGDENVEGLMATIIDIKSELNAHLEDYRNGAEKAVVTKHGSHNQASHGRKGSKGSGASSNGSLSNEGPLADAKNAAVDAKEAVGNMISGAKEKLKNMQASPNKGFAAAIERSKGVIKGYQDARDLIGKPKELAALKSTMNRAKKDIQLPRNSALDKAFVTGYADAAIQVANDYGDIDTTI